MNLRLWALAALLALSAVGTGNAYHIHNDPRSLSGPDPRLFDSSTDLRYVGPDVNNPVPPLPPPLDQAGKKLPDHILENGEMLAGLTACEHQDVVQDLVGLNPLGPVSTAGHGGLCFISPGYDDTSSGCVWDGLSGGSDADGRSNGNAPDYNSAGSCLTPPELGGGPLPPITTSPGHDWIEIQLKPACGGAACGGADPLPLNSQYDGFSCDSPTPTSVDGGGYGSGAVLGGVYTKVYLDAVDAYLHTDGHIAVTTPQAITNFATYVITQPGGPSSWGPSEACHAPLPWYLG